MPPISTYRVQEFVAQRFWSHVFRDQRRTAGLVKNHGPGTQRLFQSVNIMGPSSIMDVPAHPFNRITYEECGNLVALAVGVLLDLGVKAGSCVGFVQSNSFEAFVATLAVHTIGGTIVAVDPKGYLHPKPPKFLDALEKCDVVLGEDYLALRVTEHHFKKAILPTFYCVLLKDAPNYSGSNLRPSGIDEPAPQLELVFDERAKQCMDKVWKLWMGVLDSPYQARVRQPFGHVQPEQPAYIQVERLFFENAQCELSFGDLASAVKDITADRVFGRDMTARAVSHLPNGNFGHIIAQSACIYAGVPIVFTNSDEVVSTYSTTAPTVAIGLPPQWEVVRNEMQARLTSKFGIRSNLLRLAKMLGRKRLQAQLEESLAYQWARDQFGGNLRAVLIAGGAYYKKADDFFQSIDVKVFRDPER